MTVTDMRRSLAEVRALLSQQNMTSPFDMRHILSNGTPVWEFVHKVALGLHHKRSHNRRRAAAASSTESARVEDEGTNSDDAATA